MGKTIGIDVCYVCGSMKKSRTDFGYNEIRCIKCNDTKFDTDSKPLYISIKLVRMINNIIKNRETFYNGDVEILDGIIWKYYMVRLLSSKDMKRINEIYEKYLK